MPFSTLQYLTVVQLKSIAKDMNVSFHNNIKKAELIELLSKVLPLDFDVAPYVRIDVLSNVDSIHDLIKKQESAKKTKSFADPLTETGTLETTTKPATPAIQSPISSENEAFESALFDVTNYEPVRKTSPLPYSRMPENNNSTSTSQTPVRRSRFGPASTKTPVPPTQDTEKKQNTPNIQSTLLSGNKVYKQAYIAETHPVKKTHSKTPSEIRIAPVYNEDGTTIHFTNPLELLEESPEIPVANFLEILPSGYGFIRDKSFLASSKDTYVSNGIIERYQLRNGEYIEGIAFQSKQNSKFPVLAFVTSINQKPISHFQQRINFDSLTPSFPSKKIQLENSDNSTSITTRLIDFVSPLYFGHRTLLLAPANTGVSSILSELANAIQKNNEVEVLYVVIDSTPEEVAHLESTLLCKVYSATFEKICDEQIKTCEMAIKYAKRKSETGVDVVVILDTFSKLIHLCQTSLVQNASTHNFVPQALNRIKQIFATARNTKEAGSITLIAAMNYDTDNKLDTMLADKFISKANACIYLDKELSDRFIFPAINLKNSVIRRPELVLSASEIEIYKKIHKVFNVVSSKQSITQFIDLITKTKNNADLKAKLPEWLNIWEKLSMM